MTDKEWEFHLNHLKQTGQYKDGLTYCTTKMVGNTVSWSFPTHKENETDNDR